MSRSAVDLDELGRAQVAARLQSGGLPARQVDRVQQLGTVTSEERLGDLDYPTGRVVRRLADAQHSRPRLHAKVGGFGRCRGPGCYSILNRRHLDTNRAQLVDGPTRPRLVTDVKQLGIRFDERDWDVRRTDRRLMSVAPDGLKCTAEHRGAGDNAKVGGELRVGVDMFVFGVEDGRGLACVPLHDPRCPSPIVEGGPFFLPPVPGGGVSRYSVARYADHGPSTLSNCHESGSSEHLHGLPNARPRELPFLHELGLRGQPGAGRQLSFSNPSYVLVSELLVSGNHSVTVLNLSTRLLSLSGWVYVTYLDKLGKES